MEALTLQRAGNNVWRPRVPAGYLTRSTGTYVPHMGTCFWETGTYFRWTGTLRVVGEGRQGTRRNQTQRTTISVQFGPGMRFLVFDYAV
eukprot:3370581-Rhodomonas_salina.2